MNEMAKPVSHMRKADPLTPATKLSNILNSVVEMFSFNAEKK